MSAWICWLTGRHWLQCGLWFATPRGWQRNLNCRFCSYHQHHEVDAAQGKPLDVWSGTSA